MPNEPKELETKTPIDPVPAEEIKPGEAEVTPPAEAVVPVAPTEEEIAKWKKKAEDFDGMIEKQRIEKLKGKEVVTPGTVTDEAILKENAELKARLEATDVEKKVTNLTEAYKVFMAENPWANTDEHFNKIVEGFSSDGLVSKEQFAEKLQATAISLFPKEYTDHREKAIKAKALADITTLNNGGGGSASVNKDALDLNKQKTEEELHAERMSKLLNKNLFWLKKK